MTFGEQFLFRTQVDTNLHCNDWTTPWPKQFEMLFKVKAVWAALVIVFFAVQLVEWFIRSRHILQLQDQKHRKRDSIASLTKPRDELHREFHTSYISSKPILSILSTDHLSGARSVIAVVLAAYGVVDCFVEVMYIMTVRKPEQGLNDWGYGQILAVLIWAPVIVEFLHAIFKPFRGAHKRPEEKESRSGVSDEDNQLHHHGANVMMNEKASPQAHVTAEKPEGAEEERPEFTTDPWEAAENLASEL